MNQEIKQKWIEALNSGEYQQTKDGLKDDKGYCCLGVLCDIVKNDIKLEWVKKEDNNDDNFYFMNNSSRVLPFKVAEYVDLPCGNPDFIFNENETNLAQLNDNGMDFKQIAEIIEKHF